MALSSAFPRRSCSISSVLTVTFLITSLISIVGQLRPSWPRSLPEDLLALDIAARIRTDPAAASLASADFGNLTAAASRRRGPPPPAAAVLYPSSPDDIAALVRFSYASPRPFPISARGHGHSIRGQATAPGGAVVDMAALGSGRSDRINVSAGERHVDAGGEQLWGDVLRAALLHGLAPRSWTDYLHLTVGGTLSNAGISGQAFRHGPQIANVYELDVITGTGETLTCSGDLNSDLFYAVLGGLGQFGIITRARIALDPAPKMVRWARLIYTDAAVFTMDQERLISPQLGGGRGGGGGGSSRLRLDYLEGSIIADHSLIGSWRSSSFFSEPDIARISALAAQRAVHAVYCIEAVIYYDDMTSASVDQELNSLLRELRFEPGFVFTRDLSYVAFLERVHEGERKLRSAGLWDVPHPWLNIFIPRSQILDFDRGVFKGILKDNKAMGPILIYPMNKSKWDDRMSAVVPDEEVFYTIGLLRSAIDDDLEYLEAENYEILRFCDKVGIEFKQYLPHHTTQTDWMKHFGPKWDKFVEMKMKYDPKALLSPGQRIFTPSMEGHATEELNKALY